MQSNEKLILDYYKQLLTLSTASILVPITFLEKLPAHPEGHQYFAEGLFLVLTALIISFCGYSVAVFNYSQKNSIPSRLLESIIGLGLIGGATCFVSGLWCVIKMAAVALAA